MIAVFQLAAKTPLLIDVLIKWVIGLMMHGISFFNRVGGITSSSQHFGRMDAIISSISSSVNGENSSIVGAS